MKKVVKHLFLAAFCAFTAVSFSACSDDDNENNPIIGPDPDPTPEVCNITVEAYYKGDVYETGTGNMWINFMEGLTYDAELEDYRGPGYIICLDFNTALTSNADYAELAAGKYTGSASDESHAEFTLNLADFESYIVEYDADGDYDFVEFTSGEVNVAYDNGIYTIDATLTTYTGEEKTLHFVGKIPVINISEEGEQSNMTGNVDLSSELTQGCFTLWGEVFDTEASNYATIILAGKDYDLNQNYGNSPSVTLALNVTPDSEELPEGTYQMLDFETAEDFDAFTAFPGLYEPSVGGFLGCWYYATLQGVQGALKKGTVTVAKNTSGKYTISFELYDGYDHQVKGTYSGTLRQQTPVE